MNFIDTAPTDLWLDTARQCPWATFFHTPHWAKLIAGVAAEFQPACPGFELADGTTALLPCVVRRQRKLLATRRDYKSMEPGVYGGFIAPRPLTSAEVTQMAHHLLTLKNSSGRIVESPFMHAPLPPTFKVKQLSTHIIDLRPGYATIQKNFSRGQKSNIRQAEKKQVTFRTAETPTDIEEYYRLYLESIKRWGDSAAGTTPKALLENIFSAARPHARYWLAEAEGTIIAGVLTLCWNKTIVYWHGASKQDYFKCYPNNLLHSRIIAWGCENGYDYYDMGASLGLKGVIRFKESFGAQAETFYSYRWK